jgi:hypothetical protein
MLRRKRQVKMKSNIICGYLCCKVSGPGGSAAVKISVIYMNRGKAEITHKNNTMIK